MPSQNCLTRSAAVLRSAHPASRHTLMPAMNRALPSLPKAEKDKPAPPTLADNGSMNKNRSEKRKRKTSISAPDTFRKCTRATIYISFQASNVSLHQHILLQSVPRPPALIAPLFDLK
jgi:hypothetical protein